MNNNQSNETKNRIIKLKNLKRAGVIPYANKFNRNSTIATLIKEKNLQDVNNLMKLGSKRTFSIAGRMISFRSHGKLSFAKIIDQTGQIQLCFVRDLVFFNTGKKIVTDLIIGENNFTAYKIAEKFLDLGDIIGISGELFLTKHGERTLFVNEFQLLAKALRPLPEKFHGLNDQEIIYRQRYLDMITNRQTFNRVLFRSNFIRHLRNFYYENGFTEIETPILGNSASGAAAKPFSTHHNFFNEDFYLRISFETALKKATAGGLEKVFEIGKDFRNEGSDPSHLQEFTQTEHYVAYWNFEDNMKFAEKMFNYLFDKLNLPKKITIKDKENNPQEVDFSTPWEKIDYIKGVKKACGIDVSQYTMKDEKELRQEIKAKNIEFEKMDQMGTTTLIDYLYKKVLRPNILGPAFVYNYPKTMQPLARTSDENPKIVEQFQLVINGWEVIKAYSELVDPLLQQTNFDEQTIALEKGDEEATSGDDDFVLAMEYGMPCQSGFGMGIERIITLLTGQNNLRDSVIFPLMKKNENK